MGNFVVDDYEWVDFVGEIPTTYAEGLELSIEKWRFCLDHLGIIRSDGAGTTCGLCLIACDGGCKNNELGKCPIANRIGALSCHETPYYDAKAAIRSAYLQERDIEECKEDVQKEINFLVDLQHYL